MYKGSCVRPGTILALGLGPARCGLAVSRKRLGCVRNSHGEDRQSKASFR